MTTIVGLPLGLALLLLAPLAAGQSNLGELLDTGAQKLSAEEFRRDIVQRTIIGPTPTGGAVEVMYVANGTIQGLGTAPGAENIPFSFNAIRGEWTIDEGERICAAMQVLSPGGGRTAVLPQRCQFWFKLGDAYFISDSDSDRRAKVLRRTIQSSSVPVATPPDLGRLLAAGASKLSAAEFKRDVAQRTIIGSKPTGGGAVEMMYAANGSIQGIAQPFGGFSWNGKVSGDWTIVDDERVCSTMQIRYSATGGTSAAPPVEVFPQRCQFWFRLGDAFFISDSDSDRDATVFRRTIKQ